MDRISKAVRSRIMGSVRSNGNKTTEIAMGKLLWAAGLRGYRKHWPIEGKPDFAWPGLKVAVFVDGCFWHGCRRCNFLPKTHTDYWNNKIASNRRRDRTVSRKLRQAGWTVIRIWECSIASPSNLTMISQAIAYKRLSLRGIAGPFPPKMR